MRFRREAAWRVITFIFVGGMAAVMSGADIARTSAAGVTSASAARSQDVRDEIRLRSLVGGGRGRLIIEATRGGGRARLTVLGLPRPQTLAATAQTFLVWASNDGRIVRLGELVTDARGNGGLEFAHPPEFTRYTLVVTAEADAGASRPSAPVLSTRANEARALFAPPDDAVPATPTTSPADAAKNGGANPPRASDATDAGPDFTPSMSTRSRRRGGDFYTEVDDALEAGGGGRVLELASTPLAQNASGRARVTTQTGTAFGRVRFRDLPLPSAIGADTYVLWGVGSDGRIFYMGSLPANADINRAEMYVRTRGIGAETFNLFVTAEQQRPVARPSEQRVLSTQQPVQRVK